jgi:hypothetical protein
MQNKRKIKKPAIAKSGENYSALSLIKGIKNALPE